MVDNDYYRKMGMASSIMMRSDKYWRYPIASLQIWIEPAILLDQIHFWHNSDTSLAGYMTWAFLADDTEYRLIHEPMAPMHLSEWNEGSHIWIIDMVILNGEIRKYIRESFTKIFPAASEIKSLRRRANGSVRKIVTWRNRT